ncbi:MAG: TlpA disulfide reductase family protein [Pseudomonadota bacterium]|jgi:thiol-disulfide isomerase/thioredoxin
MPIFYPVEPPDVKAFLAILLLMFCAPAQAESPVQMPAAAPLFDATLWDADDRPFALAALRGRPLVVNFWARWCGPCRVEIPELVKVHRKLQDKGLAVVGIGLEDKADTVREFAQAYDMEYTVLLAKEQGIPLLRALGNAKAGLPYTLVIDAQGLVVARKLGLMTRAELEAAVAGLF